MAPHAPKRVSRVEKRGIIISMVALFGAIIVLVFFGISGLGQSSDQESESVLVFTGGSPDRTDVVTGPAAPVAFDDDMEVGAFGEPVDDLFADDEGGGWGASAQERSDEQRGEVAARERPRTGRISRGRGPRRD